MTYLNLSNRIITWRFIVIVSLIALQILLIVLVYSRSVSLRYHISALNKEAVIFNTKSADFKKDLYNILDFKNPENLAAEFGLIRDSRPEYVVSLRASN